jgi:hypothetical protein
MTGALTGLRVVEIAVTSQARIARSCSSTSVPTSSRSSRRPVTRC